MAEKNKEIVRVNLSAEQRAAIQKATGIDVSTLEVHEVVGEAARTLSPNFLKAVVVVCCW